MNLKSQDPKVGLARQFVRFRPACSAVALGVFSFAVALGQTPENLVIEGIPAIPPEIRATAGRYLESRRTAFNDWHPKRREVLLITRFAEAPQLHQVRTPGGARRQLTFLQEPVAGGSFQPRTGEFIVFSQDTGGGEFFQLFRCDPAGGAITLLTDGKSRNSEPVWAPSGRWLAYTSTRRNGRDADIYVMDPARPETSRRVLEVNGGGWSVQDWSPDETQVLLMEYVSINESHLHQLDLKTGATRRVTPEVSRNVAWGDARYARIGAGIFATSDLDSEFRRLGRLDPANGRFTPLTGHLSRDVSGLEVSPDGSLIAFVTNEDGAGVLRLLNAKTGRELVAPRIPTGVISGLKWHPNGRDLGFTLSSARSPSDVYSVDVKTRRLERWTESELGGLDASTFAEPEQVRLKSFDDLGISAFIYRPAPGKFPGKRPALIVIHGGPEAQARPVFQAQLNYFVNELGIAIIHPNVRGSDGYGKTFLTLDNGFKREDSVKDIGSVIDWVRRDARLDGDRIGVMGGSYGGFMVLASLAQYNDLLRCGVDVVGISNFLTFLKNTQDYRRDLRRAEYGDERDPRMREFLERISPTTNVRKITKPLLVVQGMNDPRVPVTESEQMVKALRDNGGTVWYLMARDEGHGFKKKSNVDYQFLATILFLREHLLNPAPNRP